MDINANTAAREVAQDLDAGRKKEAFAKMQGYMSQIGAMFSDPRQANAVQKDFAKTIDRYEKNGVGADLTIENDENGVQRRWKLTDAKPPSALPPSETLSLSQRVARVGDSKVGSLYGFPPEQTHFGVERNNTPNFGVAPADGRDPAARASRVQHEFPSLGTLPVPSVRLPDTVPTPVPARAPVYRGVESEPPKTSGGQVRYNQIPRPGQRVVDPLQPPLEGSIEAVPPPPIDANAPGGSRPAGKRSMAGIDLPVKGFNFRMSANEFAPTEAPPGVLANAASWEIKDSQSINARREFSDLGVGNLAPFVQLNPDGSYSREVKNRRADNCFAVAFSADGHPLAALEYVRDQQGRFAYKQQYLFNYQQDKIEVEQYTARGFVGKTSYFKDGQNTTAVEYWSTQSLTEPLTKFNPTRHPDFRVDFKPDSNHIEVHKKGASGLYGGGLESSGPEAFSDLNKVINNFRFYNLFGAKR